MATERQWCDMPSELLSLIAGHLDVIDRLRFGAVCKDFFGAASYHGDSTTRAIGAIGSIPWFLEYGEKYCSLLTFSNERRTNLSFKELQGATVLKSFGGWLLVFKQGSIFFFCPFSEARIDLPNLPYSQVTNHIAAISYPPTFPLCTVAIISRSSDDHLHLDVIDRFSLHWTSWDVAIGREVIDTVKAATCHGGQFYFLADPKDKDGGLEVECFAYRPGDPNGRLGTFVFLNNINNDNVDPPPAAAALIWELPKGPLGVKELIKLETPGFGNLLVQAAKVVGIKEMLCLDDDVELSTCGIDVSHTLLYNEIIKSTSQPHHVNGASIRRVKGVWIHPVSHEISTDIWENTWFIST